MLGSTKLTQVTSPILSNPTSPPPQPRTTGINGNGSKVDGVLVVVTGSGARIFKPAASKGAAKSWDTVICHAAAMTRAHDQGYALVGLFGDGSARAFSVPALREIGSARLPGALDTRRLGETLVTGSGDGSIKLWDIVLNVRSFHFTDERLPTHVGSVAQEFPIQSWNEHKREVFCVDWNNIQKELFVSSSWDHLVKIVRPPSSDLNPLHRLTISRSGRQNGRRR